VIASEAQRGPTVAARGDIGFDTGDMGAGWGWGSPVTIAQRTDSLVIEYVFFAPYDLQPPIRLAYALDGAQSSNTLMIGHAALTQNARARWRDSALAIVATFPTPAGAPGGSTEVRQTLALDGPRRLVVETVRTAAMGGPADTTRAVYTKR
jgi:hypothetical protein